jgi:hypothetical protein
LPSSSTASRRSSATRTEDGEFLHYQADIAVVLHHLAQILGHADAIGAAVVEELHHHHIAVRVSDDRRTGISVELFPPANQGLARLLLLQFLLTIAISLRGFDQDLRVRQEVVANQLPDRFFLGRSETGGLVVLGADRRGHKADQQGRNPQ